MQSYLETYGVWSVLLQSLKGAMKSRDAIGRIGTLGTVPCYLEFAAELRLCPKLKGDHLQLPVGLNM